MAIHSEVDFSPLHVVKKNLVDAHRSAYRVYKSPAEFVTVEAATALEALRESGIKQPVRIVREIRFMDRMLDGSRFSKEEDIVATANQGEAYDASSDDAPQPIVVSPSSMAPKTADSVIETVDIEPVDVPEGAEEVLSADDVAALLGDEAQAN